jgi:hypothetical protein
MPKPQNLIVKRMETISAWREAARRKADEYKDDPIVFFVKPLIGVAILGVLLFVGTQISNRVEFVLGSVSCVSFILCFANQDTRRFVARKWIYRKTFNELKEKETIPLRIVAEKMKEDTEQVFRKLVVWLREIQKDADEKHVRLIEKQVDLMLESGSTEDTFFKDRKDSLSDVGIKADTLILQIENEGDSFAEFFRRLRLIEAIQESGPSCRYGEQWGSLNDLLNETSQVVHRKISEIKDRVEVLSSIVG